MNSPAERGARNPYPGLRPFRPDEEHLFFGRERQVDRMIAKLSANRLLAVVGGSGSGKSSLVNCGLRPALNRGYMASAGSNWRVATFRPGSDPIGALAQALARPGVLFDQPRTGALTAKDLVSATLRLGSLGLVQMVDRADLPPGTQLLIVADQFEELFRFNAHESGRVATGKALDHLAFVQLLLEAAAQTEMPIHVVLTMRSDFLGDCAQFPGLPEAINEGQYLVPRLTRDQIRAAITGPAQVMGASISNVLVTRLLNDVGENPDQLSILQHALNRTWARWSAKGAKGELTLQDYEDIGGMADALNRHAEKAYHELDAAGRQLCEKVFKTLTDTGTDARGIRRMTRLDRLCAIDNATVEQLTPVFDAFRKPSRSFLMPPASERLEPDSDIDISHESLMRLWKRLGRWADDEAHSAQIFRELRDRARQHAAGGAGLLREPELGITLDWRKRVGPTPAWADLYGGGFDEAMDYLDDSWEAEVRRRARRTGKRRVARARIIALLFATLPAAAIWIGTEIFANVDRFRGSEALLSELNATCGDAARLPDSLELYYAAYEWSGAHFRGGVGENPFDHLRIMCLSESPGEADPMRRFASSMEAGDIVEAEGLMEAMTPRQAIPARQLMRAFADMQFAGIQRERVCLARLLDARFAPATARSPSSPCSIELSDFRHPVHRLLAAKLQDRDFAPADFSRGERILLDDYWAGAREGAAGSSGVNHWNTAESPGGDGTERGAWKALVDGDLASLENDESWRESYNEAWFHLRMTEVSRRPAPIEKALDLIGPFAGIFIVFLAWPAWYAWRQLSPRDETAPRPGLLLIRRTLAATFDIGIAVILFALAGETAYATFGVLSELRGAANYDDLSELRGAANYDDLSELRGAANYDDSLLPLLAAAAAGLGYIMLCDFIRFRYPRSLGKQAFDLRPVRIEGPDRGTITPFQSAVRGLLKILAAIFAVMVTAQSGIDLMPLQIYLDGNFWLDVPEDSIPAAVLVMTALFTTAIGAAIHVKMRWEAPRANAGAAPSKDEPRRRSLRWLREGAFVTGVFALYAFFGSLWEPYYEPPPPEILIAAAVFFGSLWEPFYGRPPAEILIAAAVSALLLRLFIGASPAIVQGAAVPRAKTTVIDADGAESRRIDAPPRYRVVEPALESAA